MFVRERLETIRLINMMNEHESYCREIGLEDHSTFKSKRDPANNDKAPKNIESKKGTTHGQLFY